MVIKIKTCLSATKLLKIPIHKLSASLHIQIRRLVIILVLLTVIKLLLATSTLIWTKSKQQKQETRNFSAGKNVAKNSDLEFLQLQSLPIGPPCSKLPSRFPDSIPPLVHWTTRDGRVPAKLIPIVQTWRKLIYSNKIKTDSDRWHFMHWDDKQISELVSKHYPRLAPSYSKLINGLERSDIGRLVVLHHIGGLYVDTDVELLRDPTPMLRPSQLLGAGLSPNFSCESAVWSQEPVEHPIFIFNTSWMISNAVMMSRANHSFLSFVLNDWPQWFEQKWAKNKRRSVSDAVFVTGPIMLQSFYENYTALQQSDRPQDWCGNLLAEPDAFQPIWDAVWVPNRLKQLCKKLEKLSELQQRHCKRLNGTNFQTKQIPIGSYSVHRFMHLSYTHNMETASASNISSIVPILSCTI